MFKKSSEKILANFNKKRRSTKNFSDILIKFLALIYSKMLKVSTKDIKIFDSIKDETYLTNKAEYEFFDEYYDSDDFIYTLVPKGKSGYSLSHIGKEFYGIYKKRSLLIIVEETENDYDFFFCYTGEVYNKNNLGHLKLEKNSYIDIDKRLEFALIYYLYVIEHKEIYIIADKKIDFFNGFEQYITYIPNREVYNIMLRVNYLSKINSKLIQIVFSIGLIVGSIYGGLQMYDKYIDYADKSHKKEMNQIRGKISNQQELTMKQTEQEKLLKYYEESPKVLKYD